MRKPTYKDFAYGSRRVRPLRGADHLRTEKQPGDLVLVRADQPAVRVA